MPACSSLVHTHVSLASVRVRLAEDRPTLGMSASSAAIAIACKPWKTKQRTRVHGLVAHTTSLVTHWSVSLKECIVMGKGPDGNLVGGLIWGEGTGPDVYVVRSSRRRAPNDGAGCTPNCCTLPISKADPQILPFVRSDDEHGRRQPAKPDARCVCQSCSHEWYVLPPSDIHIVHAPHRGTQCAWCMRSTATNNALGGQPQAGPAAAVSSFSTVMSPWAL
eukprot:364503-Chlamydomonas_euryale.AAC.4